MGNTWKGISDEKFLAAELKLFTMGGLSADDIVQEDVHLDGNPQSENYIHQVTIKPKEQGLPKLVMIHGFGGGGGQYFRMLPYLQNYFECILIDMLGLGGSGRPQYDVWELQPAIDFHLDSIRAWFEKTQNAYMAEGKKFYLLGHSFGGYIATEYALRYPNTIEHLILMSPVGFAKCPKRLEPDQLKKLTTNCISKFGASWIQNTWTNGHVAPWDSVRAMGGKIVRRFIEKSLKRRITNLEPKVHSAFADYIHQQMMRKKSSEAGITVILAPFAYARRPLVERVEQLKMPICFMYGEFDWMERETADTLISEKKIVGGEVNTVPESGHHLYVENPFECCAYIVEAIHGAESANQFVAAFAK